MQEEIAKKSLELTVKLTKKGAKLTSDAFKAAIKMYLNNRNKPHQGKQSVRQLVKQGSGVQNIDITDQNIKSFEKVASKYGIDFALKKEIGTNRYLVFFKAKDTDALNAAFHEFTAKTIARKQPQKPSIRKQLSQIKEKLILVEESKMKHRQPER